MGTTDIEKRLTAIEPIDPRNIGVMDDAMAEVYRSKSVAERLRIANDMFLFARGMIAGQVQAAHPERTEAEVRGETARRLANEPG
jgi:hypothetical protein